MELGVKLYLLHHERYSSSDDEAQMQYSTGSRFTEIFDRFALLWYVMWPSSGKLNRLSSNFTKRLSCSSEHYKQVCKSNNFTNEIAFGYTSSTNVSWKLPEQVAAIQLYLFGSHNFLRRNRFYIQLNINLITSQGTEQIRWLKRCVINSMASI